MLACILVGIQQLITIGLEQENAPPSPTPHGQSLYPSLSSLSTSYSMPNLASAATTPRFPGNFAPSPLAIQRQATPSAWGESQYDGAGRSPPAGRATEELARFFREKADRGDEPLTAVEQAGVFALMQQGEFLSLVSSEMCSLTSDSSAQAETLPTAFTPHFGRTSPTAQSVSSRIPRFTSRANRANAAPTVRASICRLGIDLDRSVWLPRDDRFPRHRLPSSSPDLCRSGLLIAECQAEKGERGCLERRRTDEESERWDGL